MVARTLFVALAGVVITAPYLIVVCPRVIFDAVAPVAVSVAHALPTPFIAPTAIVNNPYAFIITLVDCCVQFPRKRPK